MPKDKSTARTTKKKSSPKTTAARRTSAPPRPPVAKQPHYTEEYAEYLERYELYGEGRPRLSPAEFDRLDEELLELVEIQTGNGVLTPDQEVRYQELEFLLLDSDQ